MARKKNQVEDKPEEAAPETTTAPELDILITHGTYAGKRLSEVRRLLAKK